MQIHWKIFAVSGMLAALFYLGGRARIESSSRNTRDCSHEIRAQNEVPFTM